MPYTSFSDIVNAKNTVLTEADAMYGYVSQNLNNWYLIQYRNYSTNAIKEYFIYITDITPYIYATKAYDFDVVCTGYISTVRLNNTLVNLDVSTDHFLKNVLTKATADPDDDPTGLTPVQENIVNNSIRSALTQFINS